MRATFLNQLREFTPCHINVDALHLQPTTPMSQPNIMQLGELCTQLGVRMPHFRAGSTRKQKMNQVRRLQSQIRRAWPKPPPNITPYNG